MRPPVVATGTAAGVLGVAFILSGCGAASSPQPTSTATIGGEDPGPSPADSTIPSAVPAEPVTFDSIVYPYSLTLPAAVLFADWEPASNEWDGVGRIDHGGSFTDSVVVDDGDLFLYGTPWTGDLQAFTDQVHANGVTHHQCDATPRSADQVDVAGDPALVYTMVCSGRPVVRVAVIHNGYGLVAAELLYPYLADAPEPVDRLVERLQAIVWTAP